MQVFTASDRIGRLSFALNFLGCYALLIGFGRFAPLVLGSKGSSSERVPNQAHSQQRLSRLHSLAV
jgi:hypothetical protein